MNFSATGTTRTTDASHHRRRRSGTLLLLVGLASGLISVTSPAGADTPQPDGGPDGGDHAWCYLSSFNQQTAADAAMTRLRNQTDVTTFYPGSCQEHTDVRWRQGDLSGAYGQALCVATRANGTCDIHNVTLDMGTINAAARPIDQRTKTSCHELGHTVGVRHYWDNDFPGNDTAHSCLRSGEVTANWTNITLYGNHHKTQHINESF
ncbi:hypothetical protein [Nocardioides piscis]|uniref:Matrixin family metalloprotease n=1 Tax=Nocardioides piscis TaxID=2714938 RepID=A0A6G7YBP7_9ACTN|nr:hypothetical protein [Nocardioides piscis]QIK74149.1 hypothetical protein G7071_00555 [Nocardioides piscis]